MGCQSSVDIGKNLVFSICTHDPDTGACTAANGFEAGKSYNIYIQATVDGTTGAISYGFTVDGPSIVADAVWDEVLTGATHNVATSAGRRLRAMSAVSIADGTATAGTVNSITLEAGSSAIDNIYNENLVAIIAGTGAGQCRMIAEYIGSTREAIVDRLWTTTPNSTSEYQIMAFSGILLTDHGLARAGTADTITLATTASTVDGAYIGSMVVLTTGIGPGQARLITAYVGSTRVATVSPAWTTVPDTTTVYKIIPVGRAIMDSASAAASIAVADAVFARDMDQVEATAPKHSLATAVLKSVSRVVDDGLGHIVIYRTDGVTEHASQVITVDATLSPIDEIAGAI